MASPVFHGLTGAGLAYVLAGDGSLPLFASFRKTLPLLVAGAVAACLPDIDYLPGLWRGHLNAAHQLATHSLAWVVLATAGILLVGRAWQPARFGWRAAVFLLALAGSHLAIDGVTADRSPPCGFPLGWPFSHVAMLAPFALLPAWEKASLAEVVGMANVRPLAIELAAGFAILAACIWAKRGWTIFKAAL